MIVSVSTTAGRPDCVVMENGPPGTATIRLELRDIDDARLDRALVLARLGPLLQPLFDARTTPLDERTVEVTP